MRPAFRTFDDLGALDERGLQELLRAVEHDPLAMALSGASAGLRERMLANMSARAATELRAAIEEIGAAHCRDVDSAQAVILARATQMVEIGLVALPLANAE